MAAAMSKNKKCAHPPCSCEARADSKYCSVQCEAMETTPDVVCECGHAGCAGAITSRAAEA